MLNKRSLRKTTFLSLLFTFILFLSSAPVHAATEGENNDVMGQATPTALNTTMSGVISDSSDEDWYKFTINENGHFHISFGPDSSVPLNDIRRGWNFQIMDANRNLLKTYNTKTELNTDELSMASGAYYLRVVAYDGSWGAVDCQYNFTVEFTEDSSWSVDRYPSLENGFGGAKACSPKQTYTGVIFDGNDEDYYRANLSGKGKATIRFDIDSKTKQSDIARGWVIRVYDSNRNELYSQSTKTSFTTEAISYSGPLYVQITAYDGNWGGVNCIYHIKLNDSPTKTKAAQKRNTTSKKVAATKISNLKSRKGKKVFVQWRRNAKASGYQIQFSKKRSFARKYTKGKTVYGNRTLSYTRKLKKGKWYVRVRCIQGKKYSSWSPIRRVRVKK